MENDLMQKLVNGIVYISILCLILLGTVLYLAFSEKSKKVEESVAIDYITAPTSQDIPIVNTKGEKLYKANCASCHSLQPTVQSLGLIGVVDRVPSKEWFFKYVRNSQSMIDAGDPYSLKLNSDYPEATMPSFQNLTDAEIQEIWDYLVYVKGPIPKM